MYAAVPGRRLLRVWAGAEGSHSSLALYLRPPPTPTPPVLSGARPGGMPARVPSPLAPPISHPA